MIAWLTRATERIAAVATRPTSPFFSDAERAALELVEAVLQPSVSTERVPDALYEQVSSYYSDAEIATLAMVIGEVNFCVPLAVIGKPLPGVSPSRQWTPCRLHSVVAMRVVSRLPARWTGPIAVGTAMPWGMDPHGVATEVMMGAGPAPRGCPGKRAGLGDLIEKAKMASNRSLMSPSCKVSTVQGRHTSTTTPDTSGDFAMP